MSDDTMNPAGGDSPAEIPPAPAGHRHHNPTLAEAARLVDLLRAEGYAIELRHEGGTSLHVNGSAHRQCPEWTRPPMRLLTFIQGIATGIQLEYIKRPAVAPPGKVRLPDLTREEFATVMAALVYYETQEMGEPQFRDEQIQNVATDFGSLVPLDQQGIADLCERLNLD